MTINLESRTQLSRLLASAIANHNSGKPALARMYRRDLSTLLSLLIPD
jgi:hypothetical protein